MSDRREFLKHSAQVAAAIAAASALKATGGVTDLLAAEATASAPPTDAAIKDLMNDALNAAKMAGANYADVRIGRQRRNFVFTREDHIINVVDTDSTGCGVRALVDGTWGYGGTRVLTADGVAAAAKEAVAIAKANRLARDQAVQLAPAPAVKNMT